MRKLQEKFGREDSKDYKTLYKEYSTSKEAEGHKLDEDDWICEFWNSINRLPKYYCRKWCKDNELMKELFYQKKWAERNNLYKKDSYSAHKEETSKISYDYDKKQSYTRNYEERWTWRLWKRENSRYATLWEKWHKLKEEWNMDQPHWETWLKSLKRATIPAWKIWREKASLRATVEPTMAKVKSSDQKSYSYLWDLWRYMGKRSADWIPYRQKCPFCKTIDISWIKCDKWGKKASNYVSIKDHIWEGTDIPQSRYTRTMNYPIRF